MTVPMQSTYNKSQ